MRACVDVYVYMSAHIHMYAYKYANMHATYMYACIPSPMDK